MYISDKDALQYASRLILILVPFFSSLFHTWSWIVELLLLFAVLIHSRGSGLRLTAALLGMGYLASMILAGGSGISQIGFTPWAGVLFLGLQLRGLSVAQSMFWGLMTAVLLSSLPVVPMVGEALQPDNLQRKITSAFQYYEQQGTLSALEKQGMPRAEFEKYLGIALPVYYKLMPALAGILGMLELGVAFLLYRISLRKTRKSKPVSLWRLPWYAVWVVILGLASYLGGGFLGIGFLEIAGLNIMVIMAPISLILGFSCLAYLLKHPKVPRFFFWIIVFAGVFFPYFVLVGLVMVGLFDLVLNLRKIPENIEEGKQ
jgi:hypothetical protein